MINPFFKNQGPFKIDKLLKLSKIDNVENFTKIKISDVKDLVTSKKDNITFFHSKKYENVASKTKASFCVTSKKLSEILPNNCNKIIVDNVLLTTAKITELFYPNSINDDLDLSLNFVNKTKFKKKIKHGKNVLIGKNVKIGKNFSIGNNSIIELWPIEQFFPILTFFPINTFFPNLTFFLKEVLFISLEVESKSSVIESG